jgi:hypothetical protein
MCFSDLAPGSRDPCLSECAELTGWLESRCVTAEKVSKFNDFLALPAAALAS